MQSLPSRRDVLAFAVASLVAPHARAAPGSPGPGEVAMWTFGVEGLAVLRLKSVALPSHLPTTKPLRSSHDRPLVVRYPWFAKDPLSAWAARAQKDARSESRPAVLLGLDAGAHPLVRYALAKAIPAKITVETLPEGRVVALEIAFETIALAG